MSELVQIVRARLAAGRAISDEDVVGLCKRIAELESHTAELEEAIMKIKTIAGDVCWLLGMKGKTDDVEC
jgi:hypothetical protein